MSNTAINHDNTPVKGGCSENSDALRCKFVVSYSEKKICCARNDRVHKFLFYNAVVFPLFVCVSCV